jgi:FkbM family methyltransferase
VGDPPPSARVRERLEGLWRSLVRIRQRIITPQRVHALGGVHTADLAWDLKTRAGSTSLRLVEALVGPGEVVVDAGSNWGLFAARLARLVGPRGTVHAFEPDGGDLRSLQALRRARPNIVIHQVALSDRSGEAALQVPVQQGVTITPQASLTVSHEREGMEHLVWLVPIAPLDSLLAGDAPLAFIKIDVEGHELPLLRGAEGLLRRHHPSLLVEIEQRHQDTDIRITFDFLVGLGYTGYGVYPDGVRPLAQFDLQRDQLRYLERTGPVGSVPPGYVNDFVFVQPSGPAHDLIERSFLAPGPP